jgi:O-antigen ligase
MAQDKPLFGVGFHAFELELPNYHPRRLSNYPHNQYVGALAEGGIVWLAALLILFWKALLLLYHNWRVTLEKQDPMGQLICGGALTSFIIMICMCLTNDFFSPGPTVTIFWVCMAGAMKYGMLARSDSVSVSAR